MNTDIDDATFVQQMKNRLTQYIDVQYEQNLMKDVNVIGYLIEVLELMVRRKFDTFEIAFQEYVQTKFHSDGTINRKMKSFVTVLFFSYIKQANKSNDLTYIKRYIYTRRSNNSIQFYIKLRKLIITSFSQNSRSQMLDDLIIKFDDWSTLTTRFLGANNISTIGSKVKQENAKTRVYDKILTNSIDAVTFVSLCVDIFESEKDNSAHKKQQIEQHQVQTKPNHEEEQVSDNVSNQDDVENQEDNQSAVKEQLTQSQDLQQTSVKTNQQQEQYQQQQQQYQQQQQLQTNQQSSQLSSPQKKLLSQLQETKYQLLDEKMRQSIAISKTIKCYENLTDDYHHLMKHSKDQMQFIIYLVNKLKNRSQLSDQDFNKITDFTQFHYLTQDPKEQLMKTGAYDFAK